MRIPCSFHTIKKVVLFLSLWVCIVFIHILTIQPLVALSFGLLFIDGLVFSSLILVIGFSYRLLVRKGQYSLIIAPQTPFNYVTLGIFIVSIWLGGDVLFLFTCFSQDHFLRFVPIIPIRALIGAISYTCWAIYDNMLPGKEETMDIINEKDEESLLVHESKPLKVEAELLERIAVKSGQKIQVVLVPEIMYLQSDGDYVMIYSATGKYLKEQTMKYFEEHLSSEKFVRIHRSYIVNVEMISRIELYKKQQQMLTLKNGHQLKTSIAGYKALKLVLHL